MHQRTEQGGILRRGKRAGREQSAVKRTVGQDNVLTEARGDRFQTSGIGSVYISDERVGVDDGEAVFLNSLAAVLLPAPL